MARRISVIVHDIDHARAAIEAALEAAREATREKVVPVCLLSAPAAAAYLGSGYFHALIETVAVEYPAAQVTGILDCGDAAGHVMAALREGVDAVVFTGPEAVRRKLAAIAGDNAAVFKEPPAGAIDLAGAADPKAVCLAAIRGD